MSEARAPLSSTVVQFRNEDGTTTTLGRIPPLRKTELPRPGTLKWSLKGIPVKLEWHYDDVPRILAKSKQDAELIMIHFGVAAFARRKL